ncbi:hypothetical protein PIROE2DRAFT_17576 [Piromyces sp. E2]|nr:hypothetical protein PIROE2DRAFT_17576 [Piromyces sp. E2]|eukprot:OUM57444.1 hypothetical protein PIROE2DRAFT_17576 [Piromyces sp. E2]
MNKVTFTDPFNSYLLKQAEFKKFIKEIQKSLNTKEYLKNGFTIDEFVKKQWNISKTQAYRYLLCAKIIDQLEEFEIQPNYERLCRSLNKYAKTTQQLKLLWRMVLKKINGKVDLITSTLVSKTWNELYKDKKYSNICHYEDSIMAIIENSVKEHSKNLKQKQLRPFNNNMSYTVIAQNQNKINNYLVFPENSLQRIIIPSSDCIYNGNAKNNVYGSENQNVLIEIIY